MNAKSYKGLAGLAFGETKDKCLNLLGSPSSSRITTSGLSELFYESCVVRFDKSDSFVEVTFYEGASISLNGAEVDWSDHGFEKLYLEETYTEFYDCLILLDKGISLTGYEMEEDVEKSLTLFVKGWWDDVDLT